MRRCRNLRARRGAFYIVSLAFAAMVALSVLAGLARSFTEMRAAEQYHEQTQVFQAAEAGVDVAIQEFSGGGSDATINFSQAEGWANSGGGACGAGASCLQTVQVLGWTSAVTVNDIAAAEPVITSTSGPAGRQQTIEAVVASPTANPFQWPLFGKQYIIVDKDAFVDSYDSSLGPYGATIPSDPVYGTLNRSDVSNPNSWHGDLRTKSTAANQLEVRQDSVVFGDAIVGVGGDPGTVIDAPDATIHGESVAATASYAPAPVQLPPGGPSGTPYVVAQDVIDTIDVSTCGCSSISLGQRATVTLTGSGTLHLTDIDIQSRAILDIQGSDITLVVDGIQTFENAKLRSSGSRLKVYGTGAGTLTFSSNSLENTSQKAANMMLYINGTNTVSIRNSSGMYAAIYAPEALVNIDKDGELYGSVVANALTIDKGGKFHYDEALIEETLSQQGGSATIESWRQP